MSQAKKGFVAFFAAAVLAFGIAGMSPAGSADTASRNLAATRQVYNKLLADAGKDETSLMMFANMMPKGGDIHHHFSGAIYAETYLEWAKQDGFCIFEASDPARQIEKFHVATEPDDLTSTQRAVCRDIDTVIGDEDLYRELLMHWSSKDYHDQSPGDQHFFDTFQYFSEIAAASYAEGMQQLKERAIAENVSYIETMLDESPGIESREMSRLIAGIAPDLGDEQLERQFARAYDVLEQSPETATTIASFIETIKTASAGIDDERFSARFITFVVRNRPPDEIFSRLYTAFNAAETYDKLVGINFVGPENGYVSMRDYTLHMKMFAFFRKKHPHVKVALHAGELVLGMVPPEGLKFHISQAVHIAGASRIGHGVDIPHEADAIDLLRYMSKNKIVVEINLTSNKDILGVGASDNPLHLYKKYRVPFVISTDDAGVSRNNLSSEYLLYMMGFRPSYDELKATVFRSIEYAFLSNADNEVQSRRVKARFLEFEKAIAASAGQLAN